MTVNELREKRNTAWENAKGFLESHRMENGLISAADAKTYDKMVQDIQNYGEEIARLEQLQSMEDTLRRPTAAPLTARPGSKAGRASDEYKNALLTALRTNFKDVDNILREGQDESGGYLVPDEYDHRLVEALEQENIFRKLATTINTTGLHKINVAAVKPAAAWVEEGEALTFSDATFDQVILDAYKLHVAVKVSEELLYDNAFNLETYLLNSFAKTLGNAEEEAFLTGDGKNKPTGILNATGGGEVGVTTAADSIKADEVIDLVYKLKRPYRKNAAFITSDSTLAQIRKLKDSNGNYLWQPALTAGEPDRILGYPVYTSAYMPKIAKGAAVMAFSYYNIGDRGTRSVAELKELYAANGLVGFVSKERVDGKLILPEAVQIMKMKAA